MRAKADTIHNWLGIFGAYIANFFVNSTLGYFSVSFPLILLVFSWTALLKKDYKVAARVSTMVLIFAIVFATLSGYFKTTVGTDTFGKEWYGLIGEFGAVALIRAFGDVGGAAIIFLVLFALVVFTLKFPRRRLLDAFGAAFAWTFESIKNFFIWIFAGSKAWC